MELQGAVEVAQNLRAGLELRLPDGLLLLLIAEKLQGDPGMDDHPVTGSLGHPRVEYLLGGRRELAIRSAVLAAAGSMSLESPYS